MPSKQRPNRSEENTDRLHFQNIIWDYYKSSGRHTLPWRQTSDPYRIMVSEYMLQQTQVGRVIPKYREFLKRFPTSAALARASVSDVLGAWQGLGYNRRALYLRQTAQIIQKKYKGIVPQDPAVLTEMPGIGVNTAAAICAYSFKAPVVFIETNIRRVFIHFFFSRTRRKIHDADIRALVEETLDRTNPREWYWALMDYGTHLGKTVPNPNRKSKHYTKQSAFQGSDRQLRGKILALLLKRKTLSVGALAQMLHEPRQRISDIAAALDRDGFISRARGALTLL